MLITTPGGKNLKGAAASQVVEAVLSSLYMDQHGRLA